MKEIAKNIRDLNKQIKNQHTDSTLIFLLRQHCRTEFISFAFLRMLEEDLTTGTRAPENLHAIILNALEYVKKNFKCLSEIISNTNSSSIGIVKQK